MHKQLLIKAFEKAEEEIKTESVSPRAQLLSDFILEDSKAPYGERILRDNYNKIIHNSEEEIRLKKHVEVALSHYLGYSDYLDFIEKNKPPVKPDHSNLESKSTKPKLFYKPKLFLLLLLFLVIGFIIYHYTTRQRWMVWNENQYVEVQFEVDKHHLNQIKVYKEERIKLFKKITPTCDYLFFDKLGGVRLWYGKNKAKKIEYFTSLGLHPETGKTLKPITNYMINKYICK
ncbi:hypothetical protein [Winogradskyella arenosi]|uniref:Uncharacterized protein n=1 Tax=Winogradskyella arenosi TaxID=533325 RepID=A0A368ZDK2_9FLAO|nr:hypothetical protein [Winogradskyella arenosi]RCW91320.1 hypothetical protein DFQ08_103147 [Winogradskyella arenosi]